MTEIMPFPENNCETVLLDRPSVGRFFPARRTGFLFRSLLPDIVIFSSEWKRRKRGDKRRKIPRTRKGTDRRKKEGETGRNRLSKELAL